MAKNTNNENNTINNTEQIYDEIINDVEMIKNINDDNDIINNTEKI